MSEGQLLAMLLTAAMAYNFLNGFQDGPNVVATVIASGAMGARGGLLLVAGCTLAGPLFFGEAVAEMLGAGLVTPGAIGISAAIAAFAAASLWNLVTWWLGIPVSSSHALIGGLLGAAVGEAGWRSIQPQGVIEVAGALIASPVIGFVAGFAVMHATRFLLRNATPRANRTLSRAQVGTAAAVALSNGANDAQKTAGVLTIGLLVPATAASFEVPAWTLAASAAAIALGTLVGGERLVRSLGSRFYRIRPIHGFSAQTASALVTGGISLAGGPVSATQVMSLAIVGAGAAERARKVRWFALRDIAVAWAITVPASALVAMALHRGLAPLVKGG